MIGVSLIGAGRMGKLHAKNLLANPKAKIVSVYDPHLPSAHRQELNHFVSAIETQSRFDVTIHDGLLSLTMANAAHESATKHELVSIINC